MSVWVTMRMVCNVTDENGDPHVPTVTRAIELPCYLPVGSEITLSNEPDDPFSPDFVTIEQYDFSEGDNQPFVNLAEIHEDKNRITRGGFTAMARDGGWGVESW